MDFHCLDIYKILMLKHFAKIMIIQAVLLIVVAGIKQCQFGEVMIGRDCVDCKNIKNTRPEETGDSACSCQAGFFWSEPILQCLPLKTSKKNTLSNLEAAISQ
jgi:hypothetical protein